MSKVVFSGFPILGRGMREGDFYSWSAVVRRVAPTSLKSENSRRLWLSEIPCWKGFPANFDAAGKFFPDFPAARNAMHAKVWALSGNENGCWKIGRAFGNAAGFSPLRLPQPL